LGSGQVLIEAKIRLRATHPRWQGSILASPPEGTESRLLDLLGTHEVVRSRLDIALVIPAEVESGCRGSTTSSFDLDSRQEAQLSIALFSGNFTGCPPRLKRNFISKLPVFCLWM
jgi:hypothetical protein